MAEVEPDPECIVCYGTGIDVYCGGLPCICTWDGEGELPGEDDGYEL